MHICVVSLLLLIGHVLLSSRAPRVCVWLTSSPRPGGRSGPSKQGASPSDHLAFPIGTVTVLQFVKEIICVTFMVFAIVASVKNLGLGL